MDINSLKNFDWRSLKKYTSAQATEDLNDFLENLPHNTSQTLLVVAGVVWLGAATAGFYLNLRLQAFTEMRAELEAAEALKPIVPVIRDVKVDAKDVKSVAEKIDEGYSGLNISARGSNIEITASQTMAFGQFREAIGHVINGGSGWRISIDSMCVGRECQGSPLKAALTVNKVSVEKGG